MSADNPASGIWLILAPDDVAADTARVPHGVENFRIFGTQEGTWFNPSMTIDVVVEKFHPWTTVRRQNSPKSDSFVGHWHVSTKSATSPQWS